MGVGGDDGISLLCKFGACDLILLSNSNLQLIFNILILFILFKLISENLPWLYLISIHECLKTKSKLGLLYFYTLGLYFNFYV